MEQREREMLKRKLLNAVGKYSDYERYVRLLADLEEQYDETLELYYWDIWTGNARGTITRKAEDMLSATSRIFYDLNQNAEKELFYVLEELTALDRESQEAVWGLFWDGADFSRALFEELLLDWEDAPYNQEKALESFLEHVRAFWDPSDGKTAVDKQGKT